MLAKRYQQFQRRLARHYLNNVDTDNNDNNGNNGNNGNNNGGGGGGGERGGGGGGGGSDTRMTGNNNNPVINNNENNQNNNTRGRRVFGSLTAAQSMSSVRPTVSTTRPQTVSNGVSRPLPQSHPTSSDAAPVRSTNATFQIFSDSGVGPGSGEPLALTENENWRNLDTQANKRKENNGEF